MAGLIGVMTTGCTRLEWAALMAWDKGRPFYPQDAFVHLATYAAYRDAGLPLPFVSAASVFWDSVPDLPQCLIAGRPNSAVPPGGDCRVTTTDTRREEDCRGVPSWACSFSAASVTALPQGFVEARVLPYARDPCRFAADYEAFVRGHLGHLLNWEPSSDVTTSVRKRSAGVLNAVAADVPAAFACPGASPRASASPRPVPSEPWRVRVFFLALKDDEGLTIRSYRIVYGRRYSEIS